jgi:para-aminobenzoate synthetase component 1
MLAKNNKLIPREPEEVRKLMNQAGNNPFCFAVDFELTKGYFVPDPLNNKYFHFDIMGQGNKPQTKSLLTNPNFKAFPLSYSDYRKKFSIVKKSLSRGDSYLTNLTVKTPIETSFGLEDIFLLSTSPYQLFLENQFVSFSPERFVKIVGSTISTNPMKGTIDAKIPNALEKILGDFKETAEHNTIVDLLRNDLSLSANKVKVVRFRYVDKIKTSQRDILQVSSEIQGQLPNNLKNSLGDLIFRMLPAGSCSGAPKEATIKIIKEAEGEPRGFYTGIFGYFDGQSLDSAVLIRFIELSEGQMFFRSGGGITAYSNCKSEYLEIIEKIYLPFSLKK